MICSKSHCRITMTTVFFVLTNSSPRVRKYFILAYTQASLIIVVASKSTFFLQSVFHLSLTLNIKYANWFIRSISLVNIEGKLYFSKRALLKCHFNNNNNNDKFVEKQVEMKKNEKSILFFSFFVFVCQ